MIDLAAVTAIDVHVHTERARDGHDPMPAELREAAHRYFGADSFLPTVDDVAAPIQIDVRVGENSVAVQSASPPFHSQIEPAPPSWKE